MQVKFWGVRGSVPAPLTSETVAGKIKKALKLAQGVNLNSDQAIEEFVQSLPLDIRGTSGGNTPCVEVKCDNAHIILDAGSGIRDLGLTLLNTEFGAGEGSAHIFMSHTHWDHIQGFPFFLPAYVEGNSFKIYSPKKDLPKKFTDQQGEQDMFPVRLEEMGAGYEFIHLDGDEININGVKVKYHLMRHPGGSYSYRIEENGKALVYATDVEYPNLSQEAIKPYLEYFRGADALIFDAQYTFSESVAKAGWGHSTSLIGVDIAVNTGIKKLILFHHEPTYTDEKLREITEKTKTYYELVRGDTDLEILLAVEGLVVEL